MSSLIRFIIGSVLVFGRLVLRNLILPLLAISIFVFVMLLFFEAAGIHGPTNLVLEILGISRGC